MITNTEAMPAPFHAISLYCTLCGSDKEYHIQIQPVGNELYTVNVQYGRRGSSLTAGTKTPRPVSLEAAQKIYNKLAGEKTSKGYAPGRNGQAFQPTPLAQRDTGLQPQLLNSIDESDLSTYLTHPGYWMQEKKNGRRRRIRKTGKEIVGANKLGWAIALAEPLIDAVRALPIHTLELDGEEIGDTLHCFDLTYADRAYSDLTYDQRYDCLGSLLARSPQANLQLIPTAYRTEEKQALFTLLQQQNAEGVVFKDFSAPYTAGRPASGGPQLKFKFLATGSFIVVAHNAKRSVQIGALTASGIQNMSNVTIPANHTIPPLGSIVEIQYLYAFPLTHALFQPVYLGEREDVVAAECVLSQLKYIQDSQLQPD